MNITKPELTSRPQGEATQRAALVNTINADHDMGSQVFKFLQGIISGHAENPDTGTEMELWSILVLSALRMHCDCDCDGLSTIDKKEKNVGPMFASQSTSGKSRHDHRLNAIKADISSRLAQSLMLAISAIRKKQGQTTGCKLTARELEVLKWIGKGKSTWDISVILSRSESVIKWHVKNILHKLSAVNRPQAVAIAVRQGLID